MNEQDIRGALTQRFRQNWPGFLKTHRWLTLGFVGALLCDALSTVYFMRTRPADEELHPVVNIAAQFLGPILGPLFGFAAKAMAGICVAVYCRRWARHVLGVAIVISLWAAWYNIWGVYVYMPRLLKWIPW